MCTISKPRDQKNSNIVVAKLQFFRLSQTMLKISQNEGVDKNATLVDKL